MIEGKNHIRRGFTFIELMVVIVILGLLAGIGVPAYMYWANKAKVSTTKSNLKLLQNTIDLYHLERGKYPAKLSDLTGDAKNPGLLRKIPVDSFQGGKEFYYKVLPAGSKHPYELYSYGPNGPEGGEPEERISAWD